MLYSIRHLTRFRYSASIHENVMEAYMQPRTDALQQCQSFQLQIQPNTRLFRYEDHLGNAVHHFNIPGSHNKLTITATAVVQVMPPEPLPEALSPADWRGIEELNTDVDNWEMSVPSAMTPLTPALQALAEELHVTRWGNPLTVLRMLNRDINRTFAYVPEATKVDSPIDEAIQQRRGVCQDYTHIFLALVRNFLHMPCRYVSGYLYHTQSDRSTNNATHAWAEVYLSKLGWVGFDPTNDLIAGERHIRVAIGRDYQDVPPTRGVFKGHADSQLTVNVQVRKADEIPTDDADTGTAQEPPLGPTASRYAAGLAMDQLLLQQQQQQQQ